MKALQIGRDVDHHGLRDICIDNDNTFGTPMLVGCRVLSAENVSKALEVMDDDLHCKDNVAEH